MMGDKSDDISFSVGFIDSYTYDSSSVSGGGYSSTTAVCQSCSQTPCLCSNYAPAPVGQWSTATVTINTPPSGPLDMAAAAEVVEKLKVCIVCGAEDCLVLCEVCVEAVKLARNRWLDDFRREIESLDRN